MYLTPRLRQRRLRSSQEYKSPALTKILLCNYAKSIAFVFPEGATPYTPSNKPEGVEHQILFTEHRLIDKMITKTMNGVTCTVALVLPNHVFSRSRKSNLDSTSWKHFTLEEAEVPRSYQRQRTVDRYKITRQNVIDAFPELGLQDE